MKTVIEKIPTLTLAEFADRNGLVMEVVERRRPIGDPSRYYAHFQRVEVREVCLLRGTYGDGSTPEEAIANYAPEISLKIIVVDARMPSRKEIESPRLTP